MELNWSTFLLEILNFAVLVWILRHFLYRPVQETMARRKAKVDEVMASAEAIQAEAEGLKVRYEHRLEEWEGEKEASREALRHELKEERERALGRLRDELTRESEKQRVVEARQRDDRLRNDQAFCLQQGARFVSRLLSALASPELEARLLQQVCEQLESLPPQQMDILRQALQNRQEPVGVQSAYPLTPTQREQLVAKFTAISEGPPACSFSEDASLLAGVRIIAGPWVLHANLADELKGFAESFHDQG